MKPVIIIATLLLIGCEDEPHDCQDEQHNTNPVGVSVTIKGENLPTNYSMVFAAQTKTVTGGTEKIVRKSQKHFKSGTTGKEFTYILDFAEVGKTYHIGFFRCGDGIASGSYKLTISQGSTVQFEDTWNAGQYFEYTVK